MTLMIDIPTESGGVVSAPISEEEAAQVRAFQASDGSAVAPRNASSVMLVREAPTAASGKEVFMIRRASTMAFVPGAAVFPGGSAREDDYEREISWIGPSPEEWAQRLGIESASLARSLVVTAARELFEEASVLLAGDEHSIAAFDPADAAWQEERARLEAHEISLLDILNAHGLSLRTDLLAPVSRWVTPLYCPRRYDTFFFVALLPEGQDALALTTEAAISGWIEPDEIVRRADAGKARLVPATAYNLNSLTRASDARAFAQGRARIDRLMMTPRDDGRGGFINECVLP